MDRIVLMTLSSDDRTRRFPFPDEDGTAALEADRAVLVPNYFAAGLPVYLVGQAKRGDQWHGLVRVGQGEWELLRLPHAEARLAAGAMLDESERLCAGEGTFVTREIASFYLETAKRLLAGYGAEKVAAA